MSADIPDKIDRYEIHEAIGYGAMGAVYKAFDPIIKRPVALKTIRLDVPPGSPDYKAFLERFATEARTAGRLSHPNIVTLYDVGHTRVGHTVDPVPWLAMEFVQGQTVADILEKERLKPELVIGLVSQIASAIDYAHREGVIHRDIKPSNVMVHGGEKVKVTDFGIASFMDAERTNSGLMMGTPSYMSPEQAMGETLDGRTDIFSLGVVAFEMLSGQQPFPGNNVTSILYKLVHADPIHPDDLEVLGLLPHRWHDVFQRVLSKDPRERYGNAADFVRDLELCLGSWFGGLDGRTGAGGDGEGEAEGDETLLDGVPAIAASDETVQMGPPSVRAPDPTTKELERPSMAALERGVRVDDDDDVDVDVDDVDDDETLVVPPPSDEETLYADPPVDAQPITSASTAVAEGAAEVPTVVPTATIRRPKGLPKWIFAVGALAAVLLLALILGSMRGGDSPVEPPEPEPPPVPVVDSGTVSIRTEPSGATVLLDGEELGETPLDLADVPLGEHDFALRREGYEDETVTALITGLAPQAAFDLELRASPPPPPPKRAAPRPAFIQVDSQPAGARVEIDGAGQGETPSGNVRVAPGERVVRVLLDGYLPWEDTIVVGEGQTRTIAAELTPRGGIALGGEPEAPPPPPPPSTLEGSLVDRNDPGLVRPRCIECPPVSYPEAARRARVEGVVLLSFVIDENGRVTEPSVTESGGDVFDRAVIDGVREWRYQPGTKDGVRVKVPWVQRFRFEQGR